MQAKTFSELVTFTRATTGTWLNPATGLLETAAINAPRISSRGLLFESQATNMLIYSNTLSDSSWLKSNVTLASDTTIDPSGGIAVKLVETSANAEHRVRALLTPSPYATGQVFTASVFAKAAERSILQIAFGSGATGTGGGYINFNLADGTFIANAGAVGQCLPFGNGWYRLVCTFRPTGDGSAGYSQYHSIATSMGAGRLPSHAGVDGNGLYLFGAQSEINGLSSYVPTTASQATRGADTAFVPDSTWLRANQGTLFVEAEFNSTILNQYFASLTTVSGPGKVSSFLRESDLRPRMQITGDLNTGVYLESIGPAKNARDVVKIAIAYSPTFAQSSASGVVGAVSTISEVPTVDRLLFGARPVNSDHMTGHIRRIKYFPYRLTAAQLQALTT